MGRQRGHRGSLGEPGTEGASLQLVGRAAGRRSDFGTLALGVPPPPPCQLFYFRRLAPRCSQSGKPRKVGAGGPGPYALALTPWASGRR